MLKFFVFIKSKHSTPDNGSLSLLDKPNQSYKLFWKLKASMQGIDQASNSRVPIIYLVDRQSSFRVWKYNLKNFSMSDGGWIL